MGDTINADAQSAKTADMIRQADLMQLAFIVRSEANLLKYGTQFNGLFASSRKESALRNIKPIDCDVLHWFLTLVADNLQDKAMKGGKKYETDDSGMCGL